MLESAASVDLITSCTKLGAKILLFFDIRKQIEEKLAKNTDF